MARLRNRSSGQIRSVSTLPPGRKFITIWSNLNGGHFRDRTPDSATLSPHFFPSLRRDSCFARPSWTSPFSFS